MLQVFKLSLIVAALSCGLTMSCKAMTPITIHPAISACQGLKTSGASCSYQENGQTRNGTCQNSGLSTTAVLLACKSP
ncbi:hypothetical protein Bealeia1_01402 [Candidatus Bealeia paramacronuclearis]|uniref:DUF333 domain-containing protein n=1 Tax=Candidatus Bealeia paramacronuclearis TaxID=1921001 RepID=A0ABZ2C425_9PROT|nr:hypothetical protein [Candidatus Bealeia paramacronuclearis]